MRLREAQVCKDKTSARWRAFTVANDALTVVVNQQNTWATCLSVAELKKIWEPGSKMDNWKDIRSGFPDVSLKLFGPGTDSGTFEYFTEAINGQRDARAGPTTRPPRTTTCSCRAFRASAGASATSGTRTSRRTSDG